MGLLHQIHTYSFCSAYAVHVSAVKKSNFYKILLTNVKKQKKQQSSSLNKDFVVGEVSLLLCELNKNTCLPYLDTQVFVHNISKFGHLNKLLRVCVHCVCVCVCVCVLLDG